MDDFLKLFGEINISTIIMVGSAIFFMYNIYKKFTNSIIENHEKGKRRDAQLEQVLEEVSKYPAYRQQSLEAQKMLTDRIDTIVISVDKISKRQDEIEAQSRERKVNELREKLNTMYQFYISKEKNPMQAWTEMEKEAFDGIFKDYEALGGNGHMHETVRPAMNTLRVVPMHETAEVVELMHSRR